MAEVLEPPEVGLHDPRTLPFVFHPPAEVTPLVVSVPHSGLEWPEELGARPQVNFAKNADHAVDQLYVEAPAFGAAVLVARFSRLVVDLNRAADDVRPDLVPDHPSPRPRPLPASIARLVARRGALPRNRGVLWSDAIGQIPILRRLDYAQFEQRIRNYHAPYYEALRVLLARRVAKFGFAVLLDAHSMPSLIPADLVLGTRSGHACDPAIARAAARALETPSGETVGLRNALPPLRLQIDDPYQGGHIVEHFGAPQRRIHALQLEVSRHLYMDERRLTPWVRPRSDDRTAPAGRAQAGSWRLAALQAAIDRLVRRLAVRPNDP